MFKHFICANVYFKISSGTLSTQIYNAIIFKISLLFLLYLYTYYIYMGISLQFNHYNNMDVYYPKMLNSFVFLAISTI